MKRIIVLSLIGLMLACNDQNEPFPQEFQEIIQKASINNNEHLSSLIDNLPGQTNGRTEGTQTLETDLGTLQLTQIVETFVDPDQPAANYTIKLTPPEEVDSNTINYLVLVAGEDQYYGYIIQLEPDHSNNDGESIFENFTGVSRILDLSWNPKAIDYF
ncbi:MAG: hypothetical protein AAF391_11215, partial [Bacteroidota bacterium]